MAMRLTSEFLVPPSVEKRYEELYDLIECRSEDGRLEAKDVAKYMGRSAQWFREAIANGTVPFAFADGTKGRTISYIGVLPFFQYETQCNLFMVKQLLKNERR